MSVLPEYVAPVARQLVKQLESRSEATYVATRDSITSKLRCEDEGKDRREVADQDHRSSVETRKGTYNETISVFL